MNGILNDRVFLNVICLFGAIYLFYRVGSFLVQVTQRFSTLFKNAHKNTTLRSID